MSEINNNVRLQNTEPFKILIIKPNNIQNLDWKNPEYLKNLVNGEYCSYVSIEPSKYIEEISKIFIIDKQAHPVIDVKVIAELYVSSEYNMIVEIMFVVHENDGDGEEPNEFARLLDVYESNIFGTAIVMCTYISNNDNGMHLVDTTPELLQDMLYHRANNKIITYDADEESYLEVDIFGPMQDFADNFFSENKYRVKKMEIGFLKHNLNIWYTEDKYGTLDTFGNILPDTARVDKMIVFSMWGDNIRHNLTMNEFNMIRFLSKKLDNYMVSDDITQEEKDELGRTIVKNKYKILHKFYNMKK